MVAYGFSLLSLYRPELTMPIQLANGKISYTHEDTFEDFDMPPTFALMHPEGRSCRVYIPDPWNADRVQYYDHHLHEDGIWRWTFGFAHTLQTARDEWKIRRAAGYIPRNVIENPLNQYEHKVAPWDLWASHYCADSCRFYRLLNGYGYDYPRKKVKNV